MSKIAAHCPKAADDRMANSRLRPLPALAGALVLAGGLASLPTDEAAAQSRSGIVINNDVLNSLGPGLEATPLAPLAPAAPPTPLSPRNQPSAVQAPLAPPPGGGSAGSGFQAYGDGSYVVTRPGTLLFPPPEDPTSTLTPGFSGAPDNHADNQAARSRAMDNAFADGPEPSSQLLIPLDSPPEINVGERAGGGNDSVLVFMENLPEAEDGADRSAAPVLTLQAPPQPSPPKPAVPPAALAAVQPPVETTPLAPEFVAPEPAPDAAPEMAAMPEPEAEPEAEPGALEPEAEVDETPVPDLEPDLAQQPASKPAPVMAETPAAQTESEPAPLAANSAAPDRPESGSLVAGSPVSGSQALSSVTSNSLASNRATATEPTASDAPVSLLPRAPAPSDSQAAESVTVPAGGLQTASLSVGTIEDRSFLFEVDSAELTPEMESDLRTLAEALRSAEAGDIQVLGFASGQDSGDDQARKLALSRALKVRSFLIDAGIASARIRVRSLGDRADGGPANRVDIRPIGS